MPKVPRIPDKETLNAMGFDLPDGGLALYQDIIKNLRISDEQIAINKFIIHNLPYGLDNNLVNRIIYYRGRGALFYVPEIERFKFLPFCMSSDGNKSIDEYGRWLVIQPLVFNGKAQATGNKEEVWIPGMKRNVVYDIQFEEDITPEMFDSSAVILNGYSQQLPQNLIPRQQLTDQLIRVEAMMIPFMRTALANSSGTSTLRVNSEDEQAQAQIASDSIMAAALTGKKWIPVTAPLDFQDLNNQGGRGLVTDYMEAMQSIDNFRSMLHGIKSGGVFQKKAHMLQDEAELNSGMNTAELILYDEYWQYQKFCDVANSVFGLGLWTELNPGLFGTMGIDPISYTPDTAAENTEPQGVTENAE